MGVKHPGRRLYPTSLDRTLFRRAPRLEEEIATGESLHGGVGFVLRNLCKSFRFLVQVIGHGDCAAPPALVGGVLGLQSIRPGEPGIEDRKSTRLNSSH